VKAKLLENTVKNIRQRRKVTVGLTYKDKKKGSFDKGTYVYMGIAGTRKHHVSMTATQARQVAHLLLLHAERLSVKSG
jgi:hypothetical protein